jgi:hypothetical protein
MLAAPPPNLCVPLLQPLSSVQVMRHRRLPHLLPLSARCRLPHLLPLFLPHLLSCAIAVCRTSCRCPAP